MATGIDVWVLGDYGPFSEQGKSIGYQVGIAGRSYLLDCGAPLFQQIGGAGLEKISGLIVTHCHDDHKRWLTDLALYYKYCPRLRRTLPVLTSDAINRELMRGTGPALNQSLTFDSRRVVDIAYEEYIEHLPLGPQPRYRISAMDDPGGFRRWVVLDEEGNEVEPQRAKVVISSRTGKPRLLFRDPDSGEWVEPDSFYAFSSPVFYRQGTGALAGEGFSIRAINAPVWHGLPSIGVIFETETEKVVFSSDTMHNLPLWESLWRDCRTPAVPLDTEEFLGAGVIFGDINDYIERTWSKARFDDALHAFEGATAIHDVTGRFGVVHTEYHDLKDTVLDPARTLLTHAPDSFTTVGWRLVQAGKRYRFQGAEICEVGLGGAILPIDADVFHKHDGRYFVGYRHPEGRHYVYFKDGYFSISDGPASDRGDLEFRTLLFEDVNSQYLPPLEGERQAYLQRPDGGVELVTRDEAGSRGVLMADLRTRRRELSPRQLEDVRSVSVAAAAQEPVDDPAAENRELRRALTVLRERLEEAVGDRREAAQKALAGAGGEIRQLQETIVALRDAMEQEKAGHEREVRDSMSDTLAEVLQLRATVASLREAMEQLKAEAQVERDGLETEHRRETIELQETIQRLRDGLEGERI